MEQQPINQKQVSPLRTFIETFYKHNSDLEEKVNILTELSNRLNNTSLPSDTIGNKLAAKENKFNDGILMDFDNILGRQSYLLAQLSDLVYKLQNIV